jgi:hypothetical protein
VLLEERRQHVVEHHAERIEQPLVGAGPLYLGQADQEQFVGVGDRLPALVKGADEPDQVFAGFLEIATVTMELSANPVGEELFLVVGQSLLQGLVRVLQRPRRYKTCAAGGKVASVGQRSSAAASNGEGHHIPLR